MTAQVTHEAEITRQHARYKIPAKLIIGQQSFQLEDWSVSGLSVQLPTELSQPRQLKARLVFDFGEIDTTIGLELEEVHRSEDQKTVGYRYINLKRSHLAILHHVINAYLSGEIIDAGEVIEIVKRDAFTDQGQDKKVAKISGRQNKLFFRIRQIVGTLAILAVLVSLCSFIGYSLYKRLFVIKSVAASVTAPVVLVRSPRASYFEALPVITKGAKLQKGELLATLRLINGGAANIESPCDCTITATHVPYKQFVDEGEPLLTLLPINDAELYIEAKFIYKDAEKLALNQVATIQFITGQQITGFVTKVLSGETIEHKHSTPLNNITSNPVSYVNVVIKPDSKLDIDLLGSVATISIDSFENKN